MLHERSQSSWQAAEGNGGAEDGQEFHMCLSWGTFSLGLPQHSWPGWVLSSVSVTHVSPHESLSYKCMYQVQSTCMNLHWVLGEETLLLIGTQTSYLWVEGLGKAWGAAWGAAQVPMSGGGPYRGFTLYILPGFSPEGHKPGQLSGLWPGLGLEGFSPAHCNKS